MVGSQSDIDKAVNDFIKSGGEITVIPSFVSKPLPPRSDDSVLGKTIKRINRSVVITSAKAKPAARGEVIQSGHVNRIVAMAALGLSVIQISNKIGVSRKLIRALGQQMGFEITEIAAAPAILKNLKSI